MPRNISDPALGFSKSRQSKVGRDEIPLFFGRLFERLLALLSETAVEGENLKTGEFRAKLEEYRTLIAGSTRGEDIVAVAGEGLSLCQDYFRRAKQYLSIKETECNQIIALMRQAHAELSGSADQFHSQWTASWEKLQRLTKIEDPRSLKEKILDEVNTLNRIVGDKQKKDEESCAKLYERIESLQHCLRQAHEDETFDPLTRVANRDSFDRTLQRWLELTTKGNSFTLALLEIDEFNEINEIHGHQIGDRMLQCAALFLNKNIRSSDFLARYGGAEFAVLLADIPITTARSKFASLLQRIVTTRFEYVKNGQTWDVRLTLSCGLAQNLDQEPAEDIKRRAGEALREAKRLGKNRVAVESRAAEAVPPKTDLSSCSQSLEVRKA